MPETVQIACPHCSVKLNVTAKHIGKQIDCTQCNRTMLASFNPETRTCPGCFETFDIGPDRELCDACETKRAAKTIPAAVTIEDNIPWICPACKQRYPIAHVGQNRICPECEARGAKGEVGTHNLKTAGSAATFLGVIGMLAMVLTVLAGICIANMGEPGDNSTAVGWILGVPGVMEAFPTIAIASGLSGARNRPQ